MDQTLIDSTAAESLRRARNWAQVYPLIPTLPAYEGVPLLIGTLVDAKIPVGIVTTSPSPYCSRVIAHHKWGIEKTVCYHDTPRRKPYPDPILKGIELLGVVADHVWCVGDDPKDIVAAHAAKAPSIGVTWGCTDRTALVAARPHHVFDTVAQLDAFFRKLSAKA
ncbi:MAG: HAD family hydrolase [Planctomycetes bacterium]|nr:HAD family hydrolase [Planctomycetota bacterium]